MSKQDQQQQQHYALVEKEGCHPLKITTSYKESKSSSSKNRRSKKTESDVRAELEQIYETYADLYPNPKLIEERRQRDTLLKAARAASTFQQQEKNNSKEEKSKPRKGFLSFLFGGREEQSANTNTGAVTGGNNDYNYNDEDDMYDSQIQYLDTPNEHDDGSLCGTMQSLDVTSIPSEVYIVARSHLTSTRTRRDHPNALRWGPRSRMLTQQSNSNANNDASSVVFLVVGLGEIGEFGGGAPSSSSNPGSSSSSSRILHTSDRDELLSYAEGLDDKTQQFDLSAVRGTVLSQNCVAISWGFSDGIIVFYRRRIVLPNDGNDESNTRKEWEAVWWVGPSGPVLKNITNSAQDFFHDDVEQPGSPLLKISDCIALHVEAPGRTSGESNPEPIQNENKRPVVVTLAVSRLGGYIELVPLPTALWNGPILQRDLASVTKQSRSRRQKHQQKLHYAIGRNIASPPNTLALTTFDYHLDVQALEVHRTSVNSDTMWNNQQYPHGPPAEFMVVASGMSVNDGFGETMTIWAVSTLFSSDEETPQHDYDFQIHATLLDAIWTSTGAPVSIFATPTIMSRWRTPRQVELKDTADVTTETSVRDSDDDQNPRPKLLAPVTTLSTAAPIVSMKFSNADGSSGPFLSVLDWNGAVQIFDCSIIARLTSQDLTQHEYEQYSSSNVDVQGESEQQQQELQVPFHLVASIVDRSQVAAALQRGIKGSSSAIGNLHWLESVGLGTNGTLPSIVFVLSDSRKLAVVTFDLREDADDVTQQEREQETLKLKSSVISVPFPSFGAAVENFGDNSLSFVSLRIGRSKSAPHTSTHCFKYFIMEQLQPVAIVETLARESKLEEAIESASKLSNYEQNELCEIVVGCHRRLWETKRDVKSLSATNDESYIIQEALSICCESDRNNSNEHEFSLEDLRLVLKLALNTGTSSRDNEGRRERARKAFVQLGTYEIMCRYYGSKPSLNQFRKEFLELDIVKLAYQLGGRGDVSALSIILFRHRLEVHENLLNILGSLPLALTSTSFCHLLPVIRKGKVSDLFLDSMNQDISELPWSHMPQFILERKQISIVLDRFDEIVVLEHNKMLNEEEDSKEISEKMLSDWFVKRAKQMQAFVGDVDEVVRSSEFGIKCIDGNNLNNAASSIVQELHLMCRTALSLQRLLLDQAVSIDGDGINTDDLMGMDLVDLLDLVLDSGDQTSVVRYRFQEYVQPLVMEMSFSNSSDKLDEALAAYCLREAQKCSDLHTVGAMHALASAVAIAENSKVSMDRKNRLIKNEGSLIHMVLAVTNEISKTLSRMANISIRDGRELIESIWNLYETLPVHLITPESQYEPKLQGFYQDLVGVDILSRWPGCKPFEFFNRRQIEKSQEGPGFGEENPVVIDICKSFTAALSVVTNSQDKVGLLQDLICDVGNLNKEVFGNTSDISTIICDRLVPAFLEKGYFGLVASYLESDKTVLDRKQVVHYVVEYLDESMFSGVDDRSRIINAIKCQEFLEPIIPEIKSLCQSNRRYLDASHFVSTVLFQGSPAEPLKPSYFKEVPALDAVETVLRETPECVVCRCSQWMDSDYARKANRHIREAEASIGIAIEEQPKNELPELPGGAVFHLATILGLESSVSAVVVKSRVIHYALMCGFHGAGAAIARTLIKDQDFGSGEDTGLDTVKLIAIVDVVSSENYLDQSTKKELCETVLRRFKNEMTIRHSEYFNTILQVVTNLDHTTSRFELEMCDFPSGRKECLLSRPIARLHFHTFHEYNRDIHSLFKDLSNQASQGLVHDSLMDALSRFIFYWCTHDAKTTKSVVDLRYKADTQDNLMLGCGLILQIPSNVTAENSAHELQEIAVAQAASVANEARFEGTHGIILPNPDMMKHLIDRGFSENGARRAVTMTGNAGSSEALGWAVQHTMDPDFDEPLIMLKSSNSAFIDEDALQLLQKSLIQLSDVLENPSLRSKFLHRIVNHFPNEPSNSSHLSITKTKTHPTKKKLKNLQNITARPICLKTQGKFEAIDPKPSTNARSLVENELTSAEVNQTVQQKQRPPPPPPRITSSTAINPVSKPTKPVPKALLAQAKVKTMHEGTSIVNGISSVAPKTTTKIVSKPTIDREELRNKAQTALKKLKDGQSTTENGFGSGVVNTKPKAGTNNAIDQRKELLKRGQEEQKKEQTMSVEVDGSGSTTENGVRDGIANIGAKAGTKTVIDGRKELLKRGQEEQKKEQTMSVEVDGSGSITENGVGGGVVNIGAKAGAKTVIDGRKELLKRGQEKQKKEQMAPAEVDGSGSTTENGVGGEVGNIGTKAGTKTAIAIDRRKELLKRGQATRKREHTISKKVDGGGSTTENGFQSTLPNIGTKIATKTAIERREELLRKAQVALDRRRIAKTDKEGRQLLRQPTKPVIPLAAGRILAATRNRPPTRSVKSSVASSSSSKLMVPVQQIRKKNLLPQQLPVSTPSITNKSRLVAPSATPTIDIMNGGNTEEGTNIDIDKSEDDGWEFDDFDDF